MNYPPSHPEDSFFFQFSLKDPSLATCTWWALWVLAPQMAAIPARASAPSAMSRPGAQLFGLFCHVFFEVFCFFITCYSLKPLQMIQNTEGHLLAISTDSMLLIQLGPIGSVVTSE